VTAWIAYSINFIDLLIEKAISNQTFLYLIFSTQDNEIYSVDFWGGRSVMVIVVVVAVVDEVFALTA